MTSDEMIKFNPMIITSIQHLWERPDQPLWLPLVFIMATIFELTMTMKMSVTMTIKIMVRL